MLEVMSGIFDRNELDWRPDLAISLSHPDGLIKRNQVIFFSVSKE